MPRRKSREGSVAGYFRGVFAEHPEWLHETSNNVILDRYRHDHGLGADAPVDIRIKQNLANLKSVLRKQARKRRGRRPATAVASAPVAVAVARRTPTSRLETLEEMIDDCLTLAKHQDREGLHEIIQLLRRARNGVVWKLGES
jgi:hypothetical protein